MTEVARAQAANRKLLSFIKPRVVQKYCALTGVAFDKIKPSACIGFSQGLAATMRAAQAAHADDSPGRVAAGSPARRLELDVRMRPVDRNDASVGRVELVAGTGLGQSLPLYRLRLEPDGALSARTYKDRAPLPPLAAPLCPPCRPSPPLGHARLASRHTSSRSHSAGKVQERSRLASRLRLG